MSDLRERLQRAFEGRYRVVAELGAGGMAVVFLAEDLRHDRQVAIKVLRETTAQAVGVQRFLQEVDVIARLQHPNLLTLIDSGEFDGEPFYVMPYVEGQSLADFIAHQHPIAVAAAVAIVREIAEAMAYAHEHHVVHRDLKPSNILMSDGHAMVADFGIAAVLGRPSEARLTETGISLGSPTYMSPEQAAGEHELDARTDVYSLGCILYELLAGVPPAGVGSSQEVVTRKLLGYITPLLERNPAVPPTLAAVVDHALAADRDQRTPSMRAFIEALRAATEVRARPRFMKTWIAGGVAVALLATTAVVMRQRQVLRATRQIADIRRAVEDGQTTRAFELAADARRVLPRDTALASLTPLFTHYVRLVTVPAGAVVSRRRLEGDSSRWERVGVTPFDSLPVPRNGGDVPYALRLEAPGHETTVLLPHILAPITVALRVDTVRLTRSGAVPAGMIWVPGWTQPDSLHLGGKPLHVNDYWIGRTEVTNREYLRFVQAGGYEKREYWTEPFEDGSRILSWEEALSRLKDESGMPGPATWHNGTYPAGEDDFPVSGVSFYEAAAYARFAGMQLPTSVHWHRAALRWGRGTGWIYMAASNLSGVKARRVGEGTMNPLGLYDVAGNVREWCVNRIDGGRLTRGAGWDDSEILVGHLVPKPAFDRSQSTGFRVMLSPDPDSTEAHVAGELHRATLPDYTKAQPVNDATFAFYRRLYAYDPLPLDATVEATGTQEHYRWERIRFTAAYGGERMAAYIFLPKNASPPYQAVLDWPGNGWPQDVAAVFGNAERNPQRTLGFLTRGGRAIVLPLFKHEMERRDRTDGAGPVGLATQVERHRHYVMDLRRTIDYLETRPDIARGQFALYGYSWGGALASLALSTEPRLRAAVLNCAGFMRGKSSPEFDAVNFLPRVKAPVLMLGGRHDVVFDYETSQVPYFRLIGTAAPDKEHLVFRSGHTVPQVDLARETLRWLDKYLGPAGGPGKP